VICLNWRTFFVRHWKVIAIVLQIGLFVLLLAAAKAYADPVDTPCGP
jgi:hypothetical protein